MKTADLSRSKRLKELGFEFKSKLHINTDWNNEDTPTTTAGEMIEWLIRKYDIYFEDYQVELISRNPFGASHGKCFLIEGDNICNALADACAWVLERKK